MYAVIRMRGHIGLRKEIEYTMKLLGLKKSNTCAIVPENEKLKGMLRKTRDYVAYGEIDEDVLKRILERKKVPAEKIKNQKIIFRLRPPSKGFEIKKHFPKGVLGYQGKDINNLLKRMI